MATTELGLRLLSSLLLKKDVKAFYDAKLSENYFVNSEEKDAYKFIIKHLHDHGQLPDVSTVSSALTELPDAVEPPSFYLAEVEERFGFKLFNSTLKESADLLKAKKMDELSLAFEKAISEFRNSGTRQSVMDFGVESRDLFKQIIGSKFNKVYGVSTGWKFLDEMTGGLGAGDIFSVVGRPASGKTFLGLWIAYNVYMAQEKNVLFVSMEMSKELLTQRLVGIHTKSVMTEISLGHIATKKMTNILEALQGLSPLKQKLYFVDGGLKSTVDDVSALIHQFKPDLVVVDGAYLLKHPNPRLDRFTRVAENVEMLKQVAELKKVPMVLSYQLSREAAKKKTKGESAGLEDISYSDAIGQISSVVLGLTQPESAETLNQRVLSVLKGRSGEDGKFNINWNFEKMDFSQVDTGEGEVDPDDDSYKYHEEVEFND